VAIVGQIKGIISAASDLNEAQNKIQVLFGSSTAQIQNWASTAAKAMGMSTLAATDAAATMGVFGSAAGLTGGKLVDFSTKMAGLASDMASFYNTSPQDAMEAIGAALRGESEPIRRYGVLLDDAQLRQQAFAMGLTNTTKKVLLPQQRVLAAQALILKQTSAAQGDFARTSGGLANQQRILSAEVTNLKAKLGSYLLPIAVKIGTFFTGTLLPAVTGFFDALVHGWTEGTTTLGGFLGHIQDVGAELGNMYAILQGGDVVDETDKWGQLAKVVHDYVFPAIKRVATILEGVVLTGGRFVRWIVQGSNGAKVFTAAVVGFAAAWLAYKTVVGAITLATRIWTVAQAILNAVMHANPIGLVIGAIVALTVGFIYLWKTSAGFRNFWKDLWKNIKTWALGTKDAVVGGWNAFIGFFAGLPGRIAGIASGMWNGIVSGFKSAINWIISLWNNFSLTIGGGSFLGIDIPSVTFSTPDIPYLARGGIVTKPTLAMLGERGPEEVRPLGSRGDAPITLVIESGGSEMDDLLVKIIRRAVRVRGGGSVQVAFGR